MNNAALLGLSALMSLIASIIAASLLVWPRLRQMERNDALVPLVAPHMFLRFIGLSFLVRGVVSAALPANFAAPAAYGDLIAGILAMIATIMLIKRIAGATAMVWIFNLWGTADLLNAIYLGNMRVKIDPGNLGAAFYIPAFIVPPLLVTHGLIFVLLLRRKR